MSKFLHLVIKPHFHSRLYPRLSTSEYKVEMCTLILYPVPRGVQIIFFSQSDHALTQLLPRLPVVIPVAPDVVLGNNDNLVDTAEKSVQIKRDTIIKFVRHDVLDSEQVSLERFAPLQNPELLCCFNISFPHNQIPLSF